MVTVTTVKRRIHPEVKLQLSEITAFRLRTGMSATAFSMTVTRDPSFLANLEKGRTPGLHLISKIRAYIADNS